MKKNNTLCALALTAAVLWPTLADAVTNRYRVAHTREQNTNMVFVVISSSFFGGGSQAQARWYTSLQSCVRGAKLAGEVVAVSNVNGRFMTYGPKNWRNFLTTIDMNCVNARLNKELTCTF